MQRFVHALAAGRLAEAASYNYFLLLVIPYVILFIAERWFLRGQLQQRLRTVIEGRTMTLSLAFSIPAWFVVRNILGI